MADILNSAEFNEVADINLSVLVGVVEIACRDTQNELTRALMEFIRSSQRYIKIKTADTTYMHTSYMSIELYEYSTQNSLKVIKSTART